MKRFLYVLVCSMVFAPSIGCGGPKGDPVSVANSEASYTEAKTMVLDGSYEVALPKLEAAIAGGGLGPDLYVEALLLRAQCYAMAGQLEQAEADMAKAEQGSPSEANSFAFRNTAAAQVIFGEQARKRSIACLCSRTS